MKWKSIKISLALVLFLTLVIVIFMGNSVLKMELRFPEGLPLGNILAWLALISEAYLAFLLFPSKIKSVFNFILARLIHINLFLALIWGIVSYLMAGNWSFTYPNQKLFYIWIAITAIIVVCPLFVFIILGFRKLFVRK